MVMTRIDDERAALGGRPDRCQVPFDELLRSGLADTSFAFSGSFIASTALTLAQRSAYGLAPTQALRTSIPVGTKAPKAAPALLSSAHRLRRRLGGGKDRSKHIQGGRRPSLVRTNRSVETGTSGSASRIAPSRAVTTAAQPVAGRSQRYRSFRAAVDGIPLQVVIIDGRRFVGAAPWTR